LETVAANPSEITQLLSELRQGEQHAFDKLMPLVYDELRRLAGWLLQREDSDHTLQTTALVHEAYIRLVHDAVRDWKDRAHFFALASRVMRNILVDYARAGQAEKRGGALHRVDLGEANASVASSPEEILALNDALDKLARIDARQSRIVEMRCFSGLSLQEVATVLGVSEKTVKRDWALAKAWLHREVRGAASR